MDIEEASIPLVSAGLLVNPGKVGCCEEHATRVIMLTIVVGELMMQVLVPV